MACPAILKCAPDGKLFTTSERNLPGTAPWLMVYDSSGKTNLFCSATSASSDIVYNQVENTGYNGGINLNGYIIRVSPDDKYVALMGDSGYVAIYALTNGVPDITTFTFIPNGAATPPGREVAWDVADNIYTISSGTGNVTIYGLGFTTTCVTSNDYTGTNGSFQLFQGLIPAIIWPAPSSITYGTPLSTNQLDATANVPGKFTYTPTTNTVLNTGTNKLSVVFTPSDTIDYTSATNTVSLVVSRIPLTVTTSNANRAYGTTNPVFTGAITGLANNDNITANYSCSATTNSPVGTYPIVPSLVDPNNRVTNYTVTVSNGTLTITTPPPVIQTATQSGGLFTFTWSASPTNYYQIQSTASLSPTNWTNLGGTIIASSSTMTNSHPSKPTRNNFIALCCIRTGDHASFQPRIRTFF